MRRNNRKGMEVDAKEKIQEREKERRRGRDE
jgi:hypothetical protein